MRQMFNFFAFIACGVFNVTHIWSNISFFPFKNGLNDTFRMHWHNLFTFSSEGVGIFYYICCSMYTAICILLHTLFNPSNQNELLLGFIYRHRPPKIPPLCPPLPVYKQKIKNWSRYPQFECFQRCWSFCRSYWGAYS